MKTPNRDHPVRNTLKHLALASTMGAALYFGAAPASAAPPVTTGLKLHLDASTLGLSDNDPVPTWTDVSGEGNNATTIEGIPYYKAAGIGGIPTVHFDAGDGLGNSVNYSAGPVTIFYVSRQTGGSNQRVFDSQSNNWLLGYWGGSRGSAYYEGDVLLGGNGASDTNPHLYATTIGGSGQNSTVWAEGVQIASNQNGTQGPNGVSLGGGGAYNEFSDCEISEVLLYNRILDANELLAVGGYLTAKYGLTTTYPTGLTVALNSPANGSDYLVGATIPATASVISGTAPYTVDFLLDSGSGFVLQGTDSDSPYTVNLTGLAIGTYSIKAAVTDSTPVTPATDESAVNTFTVSNAGPGNLAAVSGNQLVNLSWNQVLGATGYTVLRSSPDNSSYSEIATGITGLTYQDTGLTNGTPYFYIVKATVGATVSAASNEVSETPLAVGDSNSTVVASEPFVWADGVATSTITVTLKDAGDAPAPGMTVILASSRPSDDTVSVASGLSDGNGVVTFTVSSSVVGTSEYTATVTDIPLTLTDTATVGFADPASPFGINVNLDSTVQSGLEGPVGGLGAVWNTTGASASNLSLASGPASTVGFTSSGTGGWIPFESNIEPTLRLLKRGYVNFGASGTTQQLLITGLNNAKTYDLYIASAILITTNQASRGEWSTTNTTNTVGNQAVDNTLDENGSTWVRGNNYVLFEDVVPDASGNITVNGFAITGAPYDIRLPLNGFQLVESAPLIAGPVSNAMSTVTATPAAVVANGVSASTVKVTLKDASGVRVANKQVTLANNGGLTPPSALTTNAQGEANFSVSSSTVGTVVFTATVVADSLTLTDTASVEFTDPEAPVAFNLNIYADAPATGLVGVVGAPTETWNQGQTSASNLIDSTGVASSVSVTGLPSDGYNVNATLKVFAANRNFFGKGQDTTISITGLVPDTAYDLYIYSLSHNNGSWGDFTDTERAAGDFVTSNTVQGNGQSQWLDNGITGVNGDNFIANGNYVVFQSIVSNNLGNISVLADALDGPGNTRLHLSGLQIRPATGVSLDYAAWRNSQYPGLGLPDEDDDGDGLSNDYERIFGMNPASPASSSPYRGEFDRATGSLGYTRRVQSLINMNYKVWYSTDLANWFEDNAAIQSVESVSNDVEFMDVWIDPLLLSQPKLFVRLVATPITGVDTGPSLINLWGSGNSITLLFSEPMNPSSASNPANYQVLQTGGGTIAITGVTLSSDGGSVTLTLASALGTDTGYTVNLDGVTSGTGQPLGTGVVSRQFTTWDDNPNGIKVFILAGQSNMVGYGSVETGNGGVAGAVGSLRYLAVNDASYPDYNYASLLTTPGQPATSPFRTRSDVKVWWRDGGPNLGGTVRKGDLGPPFKGADNSLNGPEFAFGHVMGDFYPTNNVLLVKTAWGGRSLVRDFRPPSAVAARGGRVGDFFSAIIDQTRDVLTNLDTEFPEWAGQGYQIVGFGWHQGFNDLIDATASAEYKDNLPDLIKDMRTVFGKPNLPFTIVSTGQNPAVEMPPYTGYTPLEKAQLWAAGVPRPANVLSKDARPFWRDATVSPSGEGYHWNWNAETYFLIGKSLGDNMVDLLTP